MSKTRSAPCSAPPFCFDTMKQIITVFILLLFVSCATAEDTLSIGNVTIEEGESTIVNILISNSSCDYGFFSTQWDDQVINFSGSDCGMYGYTVGVKTGNQIQTYIGSYADAVDEYIFGCTRITAIGNAGDMTDLNIFGSCIISNDGEYIPCRCIDGSVVILPLMGDVNRDRIVDVRDAIMLLNHVSDPDNSPINYERADMNFDDMIDILDVVLTINRCIGHT